jgi:hypothetical protein
MGSEQQTYGGGGVSIAGLIEQLGREAARLGGGPDGAARPRELPGAVSASPGSQGVRYGQLYAPPANDLAELRRQQAEFARKQHEIAWQNRWLAAPALAPVAAPFLVEDGAAVLARGARQVNIPKGPLNLPDGEPWWRSVQRAARAARDAEEGAIRERGRAQFARANGISASRMKAQVHHSDPLEWRFLKPNADPNRTANLWALKQQHHAVATREWAAFKKSLQGRIPSQAEYMRAKLRIDRLTAPYVLRAGISRSRPPPRPGEPQ